MHHRYIGKVNYFAKFFKKQRGTAIPVFCASTAIGFVAALALNGSPVPENEVLQSDNLHSQHFYATPVRVQPAMVDDPLVLTSTREPVCRIDSYHDVRRKLVMDDSLQESLASHIRRTYRISLDTAEHIVRTAIEVSNEYDADPLLVLGIIAKESSFNTKAKSGYGAAGLMQVYAPSHKKLLSELGVNIQSRKTIEKTLLSELDLNMEAGTRIFKQYERQYGTVEKALQAYNGARKDSTFKYARKVLALRESFYDYLSARIHTGEMRHTLDLIPGDLVMHVSPVPHFQTLAGAEIDRRL